MRTASHLRLCLAHQAIGKIHLAVSPSTLLDLPEPARTQAWALACLLHDSLAQEGTDSRTLFLLRQTRDDYLPDTLRAYSHLTPGARAQLIAQGQPAEQLLSEQLSLMTGGMQEALRHDHTSADRLLTQGRFLRERFTAQPLEAGSELKV